MGILVGHMGKVAVYDLFDQFIPDMAAYLEELQPVIETKKLDAMQYLAGIALEDSERFDTEIHEKFSLDVSQVYEKFHLIDVDGSNELDTEECPAVLELLGLNMNFTQQQESQFFEFLDLDGNGTIDFEEFMEFYNNPREFIKWFKTVEGVGQRTADIKDKFVADAIAASEAVEEEEDVLAVQIEAAHVAKRKRDMELDEYVDPE